ncbi:MAG TPA: hypothetical protein DCZ56_03860 [Sutterella sp.]|nr:hypothetical protein [Sutterella sp.]
MIRKLALAAVAAATVVLSGCSSVSVDSNGYDLSKIDPYIQVNKTTLKEVRAYLGTPTFTAVTEKGNNKVVGYSFAGQNRGTVMTREIAKTLLAGGILANKMEYTVKMALFKFNSKGVVTDYQKAGVSFLGKYRLSHWNECERKLTAEEINSPVTYDGDQICEMYAKEIAAKEGIAAAKVDTDKEFEGCAPECQAIRAGKEFFGNLKNVEDSVSSETGDGISYVFAK